MNKVRKMFVLALGIALVGFGQAAPSMQRGRRVSPAVAGAATGLTGLYRIDLARSDKLYSVVAGASSNLPFGEQQKFFIDLTVRLTPPDLLAIERRGQVVTLASSRAPRITFAADGVTHSERSGGGQIVNTRAALRADQLSVNVSSRNEDKFNVTFEPIEDGRYLRVTRRLSSEQLTQPVLIRSVYEKISATPQWNIYDAPTRSTPPDRTVAAAAPTDNSGTPAANTGVAESDGAADVLRRALEDWIAATNARDIERQMGFYPPVLQAFYLTRNTSRAAVRAEKERVFLRAHTVDVRAAAPELIFQGVNRAAIMRFRKSYVVEGGGQNRRGEVVQELRWQLTPQGWKIFSERDVRVIR